MTYPDQLEIIPLAKPPVATIRVPGSKSITNRALVLAALSKQSRRRRGCTLTGILHSEDTQIMIEALRALGFTLEVEGDTVTVKRPWEPIIPATKADLFVGNSGTTMRFLTAMVCLGHGSYRLDGVPRMRERPIQDLLDGLQQLGVRAYSEHDNGCPPVVVDANGLQGGRVRMRGDVSSQFLSGLLMAATQASGQVVVEVEGPMVSEPYVDMTLRLILHFGGVPPIERPSPSVFKISSPIRFRAAPSYTIEPDASAASYFFGAAAIAGGEITVDGLRYAIENRLQGDVLFASLLSNMGCEFESDSAYCSKDRRRDGIVVRGRPLRGIDVDMNAISDTVMTLAAVACFAEGPTTIRNVAHIRHKETDRIAALANELRKVGVEVEEYPDGLKITPRPLHGAVIETYNDHRMAMSMALIGLKVPGIVIQNPGCVAKTYPGFWQDLEKLRS